VERINAIRCAKRSKEDKARGILKAGRFTVTMRSAL